MAGGESKSVSEDGMTTLGIYRRGMGAHSYSEHFQDSSYSSLSRVLAKQGEICQNTSEQEVSAREVWLMTSGTQGQDVQSPCCLEHEGTRSDLEM